MNSENRNTTSLNKFISQTGICSRRKADEFIKARLVKINGKVAQLGNRVSKGDIVLLKGKPLQQKNNSILIALNKPRGIVCTTDRRERMNIIDFVNHKERIFPIGRLDKASEGLILLTNNGDLVNKILRSENGHEKEYIVEINKPFDSSFKSKMEMGIPILDTVTKPCQIEIINSRKFKIILTQGLNRQIRRMCEYLGYEVIKLKRVRIMNLTLGKLASGKWRNLHSKETKTLNKLINPPQNTIKKKSFKK